MAVDMELTRAIGAMRDRAEAAGIQGHRNIEAAYMQCALIMIEAAYEDGVDVDGDQLGFEFGVIDAA